MNGLIKSNNRRLDRVEAMLSAIHSVLDEVHNELVEFNHEQAQADRPADLPPTEDEMDDRRKDAGK